MSDKAVRETLGFLAVVAGLVFVGLEIRQNTIAARAAAYQNMGNGLAAQWQMISMDQDFLLVNRRWTMDSLTVEDVEDMSDVEMHQAVTGWLGALRMYETTWRQVELGLLEPQTLETFGWDSPLGMGMTNLALLWPRLRPFMSPDFSAHMEANLGATP